MGMYGSYFFIFIRAIVCIVWYGIQSYYGANLLAICFRCMFGHNWTDFKNTLPKSAHVAGPVLLCFFLVWLMELPFVSEAPLSVVCQSRIRS
jgi:NCS1 family nucleobase:cation symporter-1